MTREDEMLQKIQRLAEEHREAQREAEDQREAAVMRNIEGWTREYRKQQEEAERAEREAQERAMAERRAMARAELEARVYQRFLASGGTEEEWRQHGQELVMDELKAIAAGGRDAETRARQAQWQIAKRAF
jgi:hypothetical protein